MANWAALQVTVKPASFIVVGQAAFKVAECHPNSNDRDCDMPDFGWLLHTNLSKQGIDAGPYSVDGRPCQTDFDGKVSR